MHCLSRCSLGSHPAWLLPWGEGARRLHLSPCMQSTREAAIVGALAGDTRCLRGRAGTRTQICLGPGGKILRPGWLWTSLDGLSKDQLNQIPLPEAASSYQVRRRIEIEVTSRVPGFPRRLEPAAGTTGLSRGPARLRKTSAY